jgi:hypothetical protein
MKKLLFIGSLALFTVGCTQNETKKEGAMADTKMSDSTADNTEYMYTTESKGNWEPGSRANAANVMKALKAYETNNIAECLSYFADSIELRFDGMEGTFSKDSVSKIFASGRNSMTNFNIKMEDWESVKSKDGSQEYVSLWYKQLWTDTKGKTDSLSVMDDVRIKNGKITSIDQKLRHYGAKSKM